MRGKCGRPKLAITHRAYPILLFFRSEDARCEWLAALGAVLDAAALLDATVEEIPHEVRASTHFILRTGARVLGDIARQFTSGIDVHDDITDDERFRDHRARLAKAGYRLSPDEGRSLARFVERRRSYAFALAALSSRLRIAVDDRTAEDEDSEPVGG